MSMRYNKIYVCTLADVVIAYPNSYILAVDNRNLSYMDVDLTGGLLFNELVIEDIQKEIDVESLQALYSYCKENNINLPETCIKEAGLICGGSRDFIISENMEGKWG